MYVILNDMIRSGLQVGADVNGIRRAWLTRVSAKLFDPASGLFLLDPATTSYSITPNPQPPIESDPHVIFTEEVAKWYVLLHNLDPV